MKITSKVTSDMKGIDQLFKRLEAIESMHGEYGYFEGDIHKGSGLPMTDLVSMLNDGYKDIPARPFVDDAINSMHRWFQVTTDWKKDVWSYLRDGGRVDSFYIKYSKIGADAIRRMIDVNDYADNVAWWDKMKQAKYGSSIPLVETNEMYAAARHKIIKHKKLEGSSE